MQYTIDEKGRFCSESYYPEADEFDDFWKYYKKGQWNDE
jgi:hypothetical protein